MAKIRENRKKTGRRFLIVLLLGAALVLTIMMLWYALGGEGEQEHEEAEGMEIPREKAQVHLFQKLPELALTDTEGCRVCPVLEDNGVNVLLFWASRRPQCAEKIPEADSLAQAASEAGAQLILIDKLDEERETKEQALALLEDSGLTTQTLFDEGCRVYDELGLKMIPTVLVADDKGRIMAMSEGEVPSGVQIQEMITEAREGKAAYLAAAICQTLIKDGGMRTNYLDNREEAVSGGDVLSESQGIMMEYAARSESLELFEQLWEYNRQRMFPAGLMPWVVTDKGDTGVNALIDDLRIIGALQLADERFGGYGEACGEYRDAVYEYNTADHKPVDFYDVESGKKAERFTLCYGDLAVLAEMKEQDRRFEKVYDNTLELMLEGRISEKFPLYYSYYDYAAGKYEGSRLNMAEALTTLLHLAEVGKLPGEAIGWLEREMDQGCVYAAYNTDGSPAEDGYYESTAVYALIAMIALEEEREALAGKAVNRMEQFRVTDINSLCMGLFGNRDGSGIYSFDQGMALLAYERYEEATE